MHVHKSQLLAIKSDVNSKQNEYVCIVDADALIKEMTFYLGNYYISF